VDDDYVQKSQAGGAVTMVTSIILALLFWVELQEFCTVDVAHSITVDTRIKQKLAIGLNITFPRLRCNEISVDTVDASGDNQVNIHGGLERVSLNGKGLVIPSQAPSAGACLSCMEGEDDKHKCCNTCEELREAYVAKDLPYSHLLETAAQCKDIVGCRVQGRVVVNKVSGNVHVALGRSTIRDGRHVHEFNMMDVSDGFNTSHEIHEITFGDHLPGLVSPLDGTRKIVRHGAFMFHYYVKLVPTMFTSRDGRDIYSNQYSATDSARNVQVRSGELSGLPGVFFVYDFSPFLMRKTELAKPWSYIFTSSCAIIGGVFSIAKLIELAVTGFIGGLFGCHPAMVSKV